METVEAMLARWKNEISPTIYAEIEVQVRSFLFQLESKESRIEELSKEISRLTSSIEASKE